MRTFVNLAGALIVAALVMLAAWPWVSRQLDVRARAAYANQERVHAARVFEDIAAMPAELRESSGLVISRMQPGVLWSHNDSGDSPVLYALDITGRLIAKVAISNAVARDWEDIASGPCPGGPAPSQPPCLYIADTGNNDRSRDVLTIYVVPEPTVTGVDTTKPLQVPARAVRYRYPDQPEDAEALAVLPSGAVTIVTKGRTGTIGFYGLSPASVAKALTSDEVLTAEYEGDTGIAPEQRIGRWVTAAAMSPDGKTLAVRTYSEVVFYARSAEQGSRRWQNLGRPCFLGDIEPQGEAIDYLDENTLLVTSETAQGRQGMLRRLRC